MAFVIKTEMHAPHSAHFAFPHQKPMSGGKHIRVGDRISLFASENESGVGLVAKGFVTSAAPTAPRPDLARQTPRVSTTVEPTALAHGRLGRSARKPHTQWNDGRPETELNFKRYRQATNKIVGVSGAVVVFLQSHFADGSTTPNEQA